MNEGRKMATPRYPPRSDSVRYRDDHHARGSLEDEDKENDLENGPFLNKVAGEPEDKKFRRLLWIVGGYSLAHGWWH